MKLKSVELKNAKPAKKTKRLFDGGGLYLEVTPAGGKYWRMKYRFGGKEKRLAFGVYPAVSLKEAREKRENARKLLDNGVDPSNQKRALKAAQREAETNSFEAITREWLPTRGKKAKSTNERLNAILDNDLFPYLSSRPISEITPPELLQVLRRIESRSPETAKKARQTLGQIFRYAVVTGRAERDSSSDLKGALKTPERRHFAAITEPQEVGNLMVAIHAYRGSPVVMAALKLAPLLFCRPGELRHLEWSEVNFVEKRVEISSDKMKTGQPHVIPLAKQAIEILRAVKPFTGQSRYVFPNARSNALPMSENALRVALRTMGYTNEQMTPHGFRAMARTLLDEELRFRPDYIEHQLAHAVRDPLGRAYNRTKFLEERRKMMQAWANYLDRLRGADGENIVVLSRTKNSRKRG